MLGANQPQLTPVLAQLVRNSFQTQHYLCSKSLFHYCSCGEEVSGRGGWGGGKKSCPTHPLSSNLPVAVSRDVKEMHIPFQGAVIVLPLSKTPLSLPWIFLYEIHSFCSPYPCIASSKASHSTLPKDAS